MSTNPSVEDVLKGKLSVEDRLEVDELQNRYAFAIDDRNWDLLRTVFTDDAEIEFVGSTEHHHGIEPVIEFFARSTDNGTATLHDGHNALVWATGADTAEGKVHFSGHFIAKGATLPGNSETDYMVFGNYYDRYVRLPEGWRMSYRRAVALTTWGDTSIPFR